VSVLGPTTICSGTTTNLLLSSNVGGTTFGWTVGPITGTITGASASNGVNISQTLTNTGTSAGTVTYIVTPTANGCPGNPVNIVVTVNPTPDVSTVSPTTICSSATTNIALTTNVPGTTFSWTIGAITGSVGGATSSNGSTISQTLFNPGLAPGTVTYIVTPTANSCSGTPVNIIVTVNPLTGPTIFTGGSIVVCQDASDETYTATSTNSSSIVYSVSPPSAGVINPATGVMNWDAAFSGTASITATSAGLCGTTVGTLSVRVKGLPAISSSPVDRTICEFGMVDFDVTAAGSDLMYLWYVDDNSGSGFVPVTGGSYTGETSPTLQIWIADRSMSGYKYHVVVSGCLPDVTSADAVLTVNVGPEITLHPSDVTVCLGDNTIMAASATGTSVVWKWYVNKGSGFVEVTDDANFSGAATSTLTITNALSSFNNWLFRAKATGICGAPVFTNFGRLNVTNPPTAGVLTAAKAVCENNDVSFLATGSGYTSLQWQVSTNGGTTWTNITDDATYVGSITNQLSILSAPVTFNNNQYRLGLIGTCTPVYTNAATLTVNPNPVVHFAAAVNACGSVPLVLNGNPTGGTTPYTQHRWTGDVGPLNNYVIQSPTFNSVISGSYTLNYKVTDSKGCSANDNLVVNVDSPSADFSQDVNIGCTPATVTFSKDMTGIAKFWWEFDDGSPKDSVNASPVHIFTNANASSIVYYNVKLTVQSPGGCFASFTSTVTVYPSINATFTATPAVVCSGNQVIFTTLPGASKYFWDFGDGVSGYFTNTTNHLYTNLTTAPVIHTVTLTTTSFYNCTDVKSFDVTLMPMPIPQFTALPVTQIYNAAGNPVTFTNTTNPGTWTWLWRLGDGTQSTDQNPIHTYTSLGTFDVVLKVSNANCSDSVKHSVSVTPMPPVAHFDLIPSGCSPLTIAPNNTSLYTNTPGTTYMWDFGDGGASTSKNPTYTYFTPGPYRVELIVTGPGGTSNYSQVVSSYPSPKADFELTPKIVFVNDENVRMFNLTQGADSYLWEFGDGDTSKVENPYHKYMEEGTYDVTLWAYIHNVINGETITCSDKYVLSPGVTVEPSGVIRFSTVFTPNKDGEIEMDHLPTGGPEIDQFFFPPIRDKVINYKLQIFNRLGVLIFESHDINIPWNGYYQHKLCQQGVYVWYVEGKYANGSPFKKVGDVTLLH
jgi:PKD repeat protein